MSTHYCIGPCKVCGAYCTICSNCNHSITQPATFSTTNNMIQLMSSANLKLDKFEVMWRQQEEFMHLLQKERGFPDFPTDITSKKGQQFLKDIRNHLMEELFEAGQHLKNAKSHRATDLPEVDREAYKEELVDALHLYFELVIASGVSMEELFEAYMAKGQTNEERIKGGY